MPTHMHSFMGQKLLVTNSGQNCPADPLSPVAKWFRSSKESKKVLVSKFVLGNFWDTGKTESRAICEKSCR